MAKLNYEDRHAKAHAFRATVPEIVSALNTLEPAAGWSLVSREALDNHPTYFQIRASNGETINLSVDTYECRLSLSGDYGDMPDGRRWFPSERLRDTPDPRPSVSLDKTPAQIAKDITRRLLPAYRPIYATYLEQLASSKIHNGKTSDLLTELVTLSGGAFSPSNRRRSDPSEQSANAHSVGGVSYGSLRVSGDHVSFDQFSISADLARDIMRLIAARAAQKIA